MQSSLRSFRALHAAAKGVHGVARAAVPHAASAGSTSPAQHDGIISLKVVSYNILADKYAMTGQHQYCPVEHLRWSSRGPRIQQELAAYSADIVCLQEVETRVFDEELRPFFERLGLQGWFMPRQQGEVVGPPEGVALFVNTSVFEVLQHRGVRFSEHARDMEAVAHTGGDGWRVFCQKEEGMVMALLQHKETGQKLVAASAHLHWNPRYPDVKLLQSAVLCQQVAKFTCQHGQVPRPTDIPVVIGGDFNSLPCKYKPDVFDRVIPSTAEGGLVSGVYTLLQQGSVSAAHPDYPTTRQADRDGTSSNTMLSSPAVDSATPVTSAGLQLDSMHRVAYGREPILTTRTSSFAGCLDYIWISPSWFEVVATLELPYQWPDTWTSPMDDVEFPAIPDEQFPSDHLAVGCLLRLIPRN